MTRFAVKTSGRLRDGWRRPALVLALLVLAGCTSIPFRREPTPPGRTTLSSPLVQLPAQLLGNLFVVEAKWDKFGPYRFVVDTGSSVTLMSPTLVKRYGEEVRPADARVAGGRVRVAGADGGVLELPAAAVSRLELGEARFENVPVLVYDCSTLSSHLGVRIDGVLGFPLFRETLLTLDYPGRRLLLQPADSAALVPGSVVPFDDGRKTPLVRLRLGDVQFAALVDSGSEADFSINPAGLSPAYATPPREGTLVATLAGDRSQRVARLRDPLQLGDQVFPRPIVELTDALSSLGGGALRHFTLTFDQRRDRLFLQRVGGALSAAAPRRSLGLSFAKLPAYWRVASVLDSSPAAQAGIRAGDLVVRIEGEPVANWDRRRLDEAIVSRATLTLTLLNGSLETDRVVAAFDLVP
jgi:hypothetical protein